MLRATGPSALGYGSVDLANASAVTGTLPAANQAAQALGGDVTGTTPAATVIKINGATVPIVGAIGNVLQVTGAGALGYAPLNLAGGAAFVTGSLPAANQAAQAMGGDVTGTTAASVLAQIASLAGGGIRLVAVDNAGVIGSLSPSAVGPASYPLAGDVTGTTAASTVAKINGSTLPAGGALVAGQVLRATGPAALGYGAVDLANGSAVTGTLPAANQAAQALGGDVGGTTAASTISNLAISKLAPGTPGAVMIVNAAGTLWVGVTISSDATITPAGAMTVVSATGSGDAFPILANSSTFGSADKVYSGRESIATAGLAPTPVVAKAIYAMPDKTAVDVLVTMVAKQEATGNMACLDFRARYVRNGAGPVLIGAVIPGVNQETSTLAVSGTITISGNNIVPQVTGLAGTNIKWNVVITATPVSTVA